MLFFAQVEPEDLFLNVGIKVIRLDAALSPDARAELVLRGTLTPDDLELLRDHVELTIKALTRKVKEQ